MNHKANDPAETQEITIEVAYATANTQPIYSIKMPEGSSIKEAILASDILNEFPEIDLEVNKVGIFSKLSNLDSPLKNKDRIEIYRPLIADPKAIRKKRAAEGKKMKKG